MPSIETDCREQKAVHWPATGVDDYGEPTVGSNEELSVRWEFKKEETLDPQGNTVSVDATVVTNKEITIGSILRLGKKADLPSPVDDLYQVVTYNETPDIKNRHKRRTLKLMKYGDALSGTT